MQNIYQKQLYKYDCWVASLYNLLSIRKIDVNYRELMKSLGTTTLWWTKPEKILEYLEKIWIKYSLSFSLIHPSLILVDDKIFYDDGTITKENSYWHYIMYTWNHKWNLLEIFDPREWKIFDYQFEKLLKATKNVLVWKSKRYNDFYIHF